MTERKELERLAAHFLGADHTSLRARCRPWALSVIVDEVIVSTDTQMVNMYNRAYAAEERLARRDDEVRILSATAVAMSRKLREHEGKGGWSNDGIGALMIRLGEELDEFCEAIEGNMSVRDVEDEGADVQNFVAMVVDNYRRAKDVKLANQSKV